MALADDFAAAQTRVKQLSKTPGADEPAIAVRTDGEVTPDPLAQRIRTVG